MNILAADIGGTHSRFARFGIDQKGNLTLEELAWLRTADAASFGQLIDNLRSRETSLKPEDADFFAIAIAGPIENGVRSSPPFISWEIDISRAEEDYGFKRCALINDFVAQAYACRTSVGGNAEKVLAGLAQEGSAIAVIGAGTGLGQAVLIPDGKGDFTAIPSEGGHTNFPCVTKKEFEFL
jgi:glucokinase